MNTKPQTKNRLRLCVFGYPLVLYNHSGVLIEDGVPAIIEKDRFERVQGKLKKNSKAPARHTADDDYLLTTKLFCGKCGALMVAQAVQATQERYTAITLVFVRKSISATRR